MDALLRPWEGGYDEYLRDESRRTGRAEWLALPRTEEEVARAVRDAGARGVGVTVQGARTGIVGGAVPEGGLVLNLSRMNSIGEVADSTITVRPGALLSELRKKLSGSGFFFPPDPTETSASIGGMIACNASGALSYRYGPTRAWVTALRLVLADGRALSIRRGEHRASGRSFSLGTLSGELPGYTMPKVKNAAGYYAADDMDLIDLFIGSEGTLGIVTEAELRLAPEPAAAAGLTVFLPSTEAALRFVRVLWGARTRPAAIEYFNSDALGLLRRMKSQSPAFEKIPVLKPHFHSAVYAEFHGEDAEALEGGVLELMEAMSELGASDEDAWFATSEREMEPLRAFRHAVPEAVNLLIDERRRSVPGLTKLGTDMAVPDDCLESAVSMYEEGLAAAGLESVIFGHIASSHVHVNILPQGLAEYERGRGLYLSWAEKVVAMGGSVSAEHGIGKLKKPLLRLMYGDEGLEEMRALKRLFDPEARLNPGSLF